MSEIQGLAPPNTSPEKAIPIPSPPPPSRPSIPTLQTLRTWLPLYLKKTDAQITHLSTILSTPRGTDTLLLTLCYTSLLTSSVLTSVSLARIRLFTQKLINRAISLPPNTTLLIPTSALPSSNLLTVSRRLKALSALISDYRMFTRLWGLLAIWRWGKGVFVESTESDLILKRISEVQVIANIFYQYLENGAYLSSKGVLGWSKERQGRAWVWSSRFWMLHVGLDFVRLGREIVLRKEKEQKSEVEEEGEREWKAKWRKDMVVNLAYAPLTVHWSLEKGLVTEFWVGLLGSVAGWTGLKVLWHSTY